MARTGRTGRADRCDARPKSLVQRRSKWVPLLCRTQDFKGVLRLPNNRVNPRAVAMTTARVVNAWETWGHRERTPGVASSARAWTMYPVFGHRNINRRIGRPLLMLISKSHTRFIRFRALPADEVTLSILQWLSLQNEESRAMAGRP
jgi:hypothetical protein